MDELNQANTETLNILYELTHPQKNMLVFGKAGIGHTSIVQKYISEQSLKDCKDYFKNKYSDLPHIDQYIQILIDNNILAKTADRCLTHLKENHHPIWLRSELGSAIANQIYDVKYDGMADLLYELIQDTFTDYSQGKHSYKQPTYYEKYN